MVKSLLLVNIAMWCLVAYGVVLGGMWCGDVVPPNGSAIKLLTAKPLIQEDLQPALPWKNSPQGSELSYFRHILHNRYQSGNLLLVLRSFVNSQALARGPTSA